MKAITLWQPWATLLVAGIKQVETRSWSAEKFLQLPQEVLIHAAARPVKQVEIDAILNKLSDATESEIYYRIRDRLTDYPLSAIVGSVTIRTCWQMTEKTIATTTEKALGQWEIGRWAWQCSEFTEFQNPVKCKGSQLFWSLNTDISSLVQKELADAIF